MLLTCHLFQIGLLFCVELLALTGAIFLFLYIKKENFGKWFQFASAAIIGLVLLTMAAGFIGAICMHHSRGNGERENEEKRIMMFHRGMGPGMGMEGMEGMRHHRGMMRMEGGCPEGMEGCKDMGECGKSGGCEKMEGCEMECCKDKKDGHCDMKPKMMKKDSIVEKKKK